MRRHITAKYILFVGVIFLSMPIFCMAGEGLLRAGAAKVNITPPVGITLIGSKGYPSDYILDDLYAKALVLNDGETTLAIVSLDLLYSPLEDITQPVRDIITEKIGIPSQNILVCATHTHSGPEVFRRKKLAPEKETPADDINQFYLGSLIRNGEDLLYFSGLQVFGQSLSHDAPPSESKNA